MFNPKISIDENNNTVLVWADNKDGNAEIYSKSCVQEEGVWIWKEKQRLTDEIALSAAPSVDTGSKGVNIVWQEERYGNREIYFKNSPDAGLTWSPEKSITDNAGNSMVPVIG